MAGPSAGGWMEDLPDHFDLIVVGTGLTETILAAAASRAGKSVLQCDRNNYYGGEWASLSLLQWEEWISREQEPTSSPASRYRTFRNFELVTQSAPSSMSQDQLRGLSGKFCIDLCPRLIFSKGSMVDLLVQSNICRYLEFKNCTRLLIRNPKVNGDQWFEVPCTRDAVFTDKQLSLIQKRKFMKFIESCVNMTKNEDDMRKSCDQSLPSFLKSCGLDQQLTDIISAICSDAEGTEKSVTFLKHFIESSGRFGPTPFLWTLYGCGELPQAFARLSAVFGGVYCLGQEIKSLDSLSDHVEVEFDAKKVTCKFVAGSVTSLSSEILSLTEEMQSSHAVCCVIEKSVTGGDEHQISSARIHHKGLDVSLIEVGSGSMSTPTGLFLVYMSCKSVLSSAREDLAPVIDSLLPSVTETGSGDVASSNNVLLWTCYFNKSSPQKVSCSLKNVHVLKSPSIETDYESHIDEAKALFHKLFPEETFLPRAPDADDIIVDDREDLQTKAEPE